MEQVGTTATTTTALGQTTPEVREQWQELVRAGAVLWEAITDRVGKVSGLTDPEWRLLDMIACSGPTRISELANLTQIGLSTVSRSVSRAIERGLVEECDAGRGDGRHKWVRLTDAGRAEVNLIQDARDTAVQELMMDTMTREEWATLNAVFSRIRSRAEEALASS